MNKVFLAIALAVMGSLTSLMAAPAGKVTVDHSSKTAVTESFWKAVVYRDHDAMWQAIPPMKMKPEVAANMKKGFIHGFFSNMPAENLRELKKIYDKPADWKAFIADVVKDGVYVKVNGKWYIDLFKMLNQEYSDIKIPPCPKYVDHSSMNGMLMSFFLGIYYENDDLVWNCMNPEIRKQFKGRSYKGIAKNVKQAMPKNALLGAVKILASGEKFNGMDTLPGIKFVKINGKWYISPAR